MADWDLSGFGDLSNFSLGGGGGGDTGGGFAPSFGGGYDLGGGQAMAPGFELPSLDMSAGAGGDMAPAGIPGQAQGKQLGPVSQALQPFADVAKQVAPIVGIGTAGMGIASGIQGAKTASANAATARRSQKLQEQVAGQQQAAAAPLTEFGKRQLDSASAGQVSPAIEAQIQQWLQGAMQHARDYAARSGQGNSLMLTQWENWLQQQAQAMRASALQEQEKLGLTGLAQGAGALGGAGQTAGNINVGAQNQSAAIAGLMEQANKALASLSAGAA